MADQNRATNPTIADVWEDLVVSMLSINQYSLERTYRSLRGLREQGLFDPKNLMRWDETEIVSRLKLAECDRGTFMTTLFAFRLCNLGRLAEAKGFETCTKIISSRNAKAIKELLLPVNGIGPKVIANFCLLQKIDN